MLNVSELAFVSSLEAQLWNKMGQQVIEAWLAGHGDALCLFTFIIMSGDSKLPLNLNSRVCSLRVPAPDQYFFKYNGQICIVDSLCDISSLPPLSGLLLLCCHIYCRLRIWGALSGRMFPYYEQYEESLTVAALLQ